MVNRGPENKWSHPTNLLGVLGVLAMIWGGYVTFQKDTAKEIQDVSERLSELKGRVGILESQVSDLKRK